MVEQKLARPIIDLSHSRFIDHCVSACILLSETKPSDCGLMNNYPSSFSFTHVYLTSKGRCHCCSRNRRQGAGNVALSSPAIVLETTPPGLIC